MSENFQRKLLIVLNLVILALIASMTLDLKTLKDIVACVQMLSFTGLNIIVIMIAIKLVFLHKEKDK